MKDPYIRAEEALVSLEQRTQYDQQNRLELLAVHGLKGMVLGPSLYFYGGPASWDLLFGRSAIIFLAAPAFFGGMLLLIGVLLNRNVVLEASGMFGLIVWDLMMIYCVLLGSQNPYIIIIYATFAALMLVHIRTLIRYLRAQRKEFPNG